MSVSQLFRVCLIYILGIVGTMPLGLTPPLTLDLQAGVHASATSIGAAYGVMFLPFLVAATAIGQMADRIGSRNMLFIATLLLLVGCTGNLFANTLPWLLADNFVIGLGITSVAVTGQTALGREMSGRAQGTALSFWAATPYIGLSSGLALAGAFVQSPSWRMAYAIQGGLPILFGILLMSSVRRDARADGAISSHAHGGSLRSLMREYKAMRLGLALLIQTLTSTGSLAVWPVYLSKTHDVSISVIATMTAFTSAASIAGAVLAGYLLSRNFSLSRLLVPTVIVAIGSAVFLYLPTSPLGVVGVAMLMWALGIGVITALIYALLPRLIGDEDKLGAATGMLLQLGSIGGICGAPIFFSMVSSAQAGFAYIGLIACTWVALFLLVPVRHGAAVRKAVGA